MLAMLAALIGLGTWQLSRKIWKEELIESMRRRAGADPIELEAAVALSPSSDLEYTPVRARGRFVPAKTMLYYAPDPKAGPGYHVYMPLETQAGASVIVNRGFVPERELGAVQARMQGPPEPPTEIVGLFRKPGSKGLFAPATDTARGIWYWRDLDGMTAQVQGDPKTVVVPFFMEALAATGPVAAGTGRGGATRLELPNRHFEYAMTWYGLAASLIGVYFFFVRSRRAARRALPGHEGVARRRSWGKP